MTLLKVAVATKVEGIAQAAGVALRLRLQNVKLTSARHSAEYKRSAGTRSYNDATHPPSSSLNVSAQTVTWGSAASRRDRERLIHSILGFHGRES